MLFHSLCISSLAVELLPQLLSLVRITLCCNQSLLRFLLTDQIDGHRLTTATTAARTTTTTGRRLTLHALLAFHSSSSSSARFLRSLSRQHCPLGLLR